MTHPAWTPASRPGIVPLHPLTFGTILGRSFAALRHNPRVLLGFALGVQVLAYLVLILAVGGAAWASFSRLDTLPPGTDDYDAVMAGSIGLTIAVGVVLGLAVGALSAIVQGIVVRDVAAAAVAEKPTLRELWSRFRQVAWRLIGYSTLLFGVAVAIIAIVAVCILLVAAVAGPVAIALALLLVLAAVPLYFWLSTKLLLAPSAIVIERASIGEAIARSWTLTRGRFWPALGVVVIVSLIFTTIAQVVGVPFSLASTGLTTVLAPTGDPEASGIVALVVSGVVTQVVTLLVEAVGLIVQGTAAALVYIDCRMRHEGLDLDLLDHVERRDAGMPDLPDPYLVGIGRRIAPRVAPMPGYVAAYPVAPGYPGQPYGTPAHPGDDDRSDPPAEQTPWAPPGQAGDDGRDTRERPWR